MNPTVLGTFYVHFNNSVWKKIPHKSISMAIHVLQECLISDFLKRGCQQVGSVPLLICFILNVILFCLKPEKCSSLYFLIVLSNI